MNKIDYHQQEDHNDWKLLAKKFMEGEGALKEWQKRQEKLDREWAVIFLLFTICFAIGLLTH